MNVNGITCPQCGALNPVGSRVCGNCGTSLLSASQPPQQAYTPPPPQQSPMPPQQPQYYSPQSSYIPPGAPVPPNMPPAGYNMPQSQPPKKSNNTWIACCAGLLIVGLCIVVVALVGGGAYVRQRALSAYNRLANSTNSQSFLDTVMPPSTLATIEAMSTQVISTSIPGLMSQSTPEPNSSAPQDTSVPQVNGACSYTPPAITASGIISKVTMAENTQGANKDPVNPTKVFQTSATIHAVVAITNAPANTRVKAIWFATSAESVDCNTQVGQPYELTTDGSRNIDFSLAPTTTWPTGSYRVEIYVDDNLDQVVDYTVQ
ncbi:MAG TPA: zinc ribbon domain-containing protein [Anaerolineaceae bacterium]|nr:zinc ribbon domain-containing protein [Anaerolineaceae bacterium]